MNRLIPGTLIALLFVAGCVDLSPGGSPPGHNPPATGDMPAESGPPQDASNPADDTTDPGDNEPPVAVAGPMFGDGPDVVLDGRRDAVAFLDASASQDPDGSIVAWEWFVNGTRRAVGSNATLSGFPAGVTDVTLVITDDGGAQAMTDVRVVNPGLRPGSWRGTTDQGFDVTFVVTDDFSLSSLAFGFGFDGQNLLNGVPCVFVEEAETCLTCPGPAEQCAFDFSWSAEGTFSVQGACTEAGDPPFEHAAGTASAAPSSNCDGAAEGITWEAWWQAP